MKRGGDKQRYVETDEERRRQTDISRDWLREKKTNGDM